MATPPFAIVNIRDGTRRDIEPFLLDNDAFPVLENFYLFRGRMVRRSCFETVGIDGRLKYQIGTTAASPFIFTLLNIPIGSGFSTFTIGSVILTDPGTVPNPVTLLSTDPAYSGTLDRATGVVTLVFPVIAPTAVFYIPGLPVMGLRTKESPILEYEDYAQFDTRYSYRYDSGIDDFVYINTYKQTGVPFIWTGSNSDFFWTTNWRNAMWTTNNVPGNKWVAIAIPDVINSTIALAGHPFVIGDTIYITNFNTAPNAGFYPTSTPNNQPIYILTVIAPVVAGVSFTINNPVAPGAGRTANVFIPDNTLGTGDGIKWYDGPTPAPPATGWVNFGPPLSRTLINTPFLLGCLLIVTYKDRLIVFNTIETDGFGVTINFAQRARWSQNGTPFYIAPTPANQGVAYDAWFSDAGSVGRGGFVDAPTNESIVSCEFIKDTLIVYFEYSTWQLVFTNNQILPFVWQKINTELGSQSTFSCVPFDQGVFTVANIGITTCNSVNVVRIDQKIPDDVFSFYNLNEGVKRVHGIRDFTSQLVYWCFPFAGTQPTFPNRVLLYNYLDGSWANFVDSYTCFGYFQPPTDRSWSTFPETWQSTSYAWNSFIQQARYPSIIAGTPQGFVLQMNESLEDNLNDPSIMLHNVTSGSNVTITSPNHNLEVDSYVMIVGAQGVTNLNGLVFRVYSVPNPNEFTIDNFAPTFAPVTGVYTGGGTVQIIPNFDIQTKLYNPFYEQGKSVRLNIVDVLADKTTDGQINLDYFPSYDLSVPMFSNLMNTKPDIPSPSLQDVEDKIWHRVYSSISGSFIQISLNLNDAFDPNPDILYANSQIRNLNITSSDVTIQGMVFYFEPFGRLP